MMFPLTRFYAVNWNGHSIPRDWFLVTASTPFISSHRLNEMFLATGEMRHRCQRPHARCRNHSAWCNDWQHAIPTNGEGFRHFRSVERFIARLSEYPALSEYFESSAIRAYLSLLIARLIGMPCRVYVAFRVDGCWSAIDINKIRDATSLNTVPSGSRMHDFSVFFTGKPQRPLTAQAG